MTSWWTVTGSLHGDTLSAAKGLVIALPPFVSFPLSLPGIISGALLVFIQSLEDFSNPATIGGDYTTLSIEVYNIITGSYDMRKGSVLALLLLLPAVIAYLLNK